MPFGDVLAQEVSIPLRNAEGQLVHVGGSWFQNLILKVVGLPHLGLRVRARRILPLLRGGEEKELLDAGCGFGLYSVTLARLGYRVTAIDTDPKRIEAAETLKQSTGDRLTLRQADLRRLPFPDDSFDTILCTEVLEHIQEDTQALSELSRVIRSHGRFILTVPSKKSVASSYEKEFEHVRAGYSSEEISSLLEQNGFSLLSRQPYLHSRFGEWAWRMNHRLFRSKVLTVASFYPLFWGSLWTDGWFPSQMAGIGYILEARRNEKNH